MYDLEFNYEFCCSMVDEALEVSGLCHEFIATSDSYRTFIFVLAWLRPRDIGRFHVENDALEHRLLDHNLICNMIL